MRKEYNHRIVVRTTIEALTPLSISNGGTNILTDSQINTDCNGLPTIAGSTLCGIIRHNLDPEHKSPVYNQIFGINDDRGNGEGSRLIVSNGVIIGENGIAIDCIIDNNQLKTNFYNKLNHLPIRQHVCITEKGTAKEHGKFDQQVVYKGVRFVFEMELICDEIRQSEDFIMIMETIKASNFRIGGGSTKGYGEIGIVEMKKIDFDMNKKEDISLYINKSSQLSDTTIWENVASIEDTIKDESTWDEYRLQLTAENYFMFSSGNLSNDDDADNTPTTESIIEWKDGKGTFTSERTLIPASSVKGAILHRTTYWYNKIHGTQYDTTTSPATIEIFGKSENDQLQKGKILIGDIYLSENKTKLFNHIKIDDFTGGGIEGALFSESVSNSEDIITLKILLAPEIKEEYTEAFTLALKQVCLGQLALGGSVNSGHGIFNGKLFINKKETPLQ